MGGARHGKIEDVETIQKNFVEVGPVGLTSAYQNSFSTDI